eukprot:TRINITY_DN515_c0_g1_i2.p1 TRINITY_DN515_c0_g1~~TRINITY_DN515_c0_g1_i2.p1  ORF type:complete len:570 (-),score=301.02 TRINITY_DN515_c0_g1_i2:61-1770(-)
MGGYCYGPAMSYYEGSLLTVEWTSQHGCGNSKLYCNIVIQYMCGESNADPMTRVRDGTTTDTIPDDPTGPIALDNNGELQFGMHESYDFYQACKARTRNMGLFIADREEEGGLTPGRRDSRFTRQNNNGNRHGYECPEERDYYPYWAPSPWVDIVVFTNDEKYCDFYQKESQNVADKFFCAGDDGKQIEPNTEAECGQVKGKWTKVDKHNVAAPDCIVSEFARDNHLGNGPTGYANTYNWTLPTKNDVKCIKDNNCNCVLRLRYNISTTDMNFLQDGSVIDGNNPESGFLDWKQNAGSSPFTDDMIVSGSGMDHQLALDTTQFGRTFQDRSHVFHIKSRKDSGVPQGARIFNLNVRGKRGNIVQAYPSVEYDFVPEALHAFVGDYIHFQWTGCDTNPAGNAGEGTDQTDRSNIVQITDIGANLPAPDPWFEKNTPLFEDPVTRKRMAFLDQTGCLTYEELLAKNNNNNNNAEQDVQNCMKLNAASQYFDGGVLKMNKTGTFYYMSSRNNNFSNRGQKGVIVINNLLPNWAIGLVAAGGGLFLAAGGVVAATFYAKSHPHSSLANIFSKM